MMGFPNGPGPHWSLHIHLGLTQTERELLRLLASGLSNSEISERMSFAEKTVMNYIVVIYEKLELAGVSKGSKRVQAANWYNQRRFDVK